MVMLISVISCSTDSPTGPSGQDPSDGDGINDTKNNNNIAALNCWERQDQGVFYAPSNLWAVAAAYPSDIFDIRINLNWIDNTDNETGFRIERRMGEDGNWRVIDQVANNAISYQDRNVEMNRTYYYRVQAFCASMESDYSNVASDSTGDTNCNPKPSL